MLLNLTLTWKILMKSTSYVHKWYKEFLIKYNSKVLHLKPLINPQTIVYLNQGSWLNVDISMNIYKNTGHLLKIKHNSDSLNESRDNFIILRLFILLFFLSFSVSLLSFCLSPLLNLYFLSLL